jgi:hypothetical protein
MAWKKCSEAMILFVIDNTCVHATGPPVCSLGFNNIYENSLLINIILCAPARDTHVRRAKKNARRIGRIELTTHRCSTVKIWSNNYH